MMRAMSSAVAGLKAQQTGMDVIGNNIANVNTNGFKASSTTYSDVYYASVSNASKGDGSVATGTGVVTTGTKGGSNAAQIGYGATAASVSVDTSRNGYDSSSVATNCYINGEGYFAVKDGGTLTDPTYSYTRVGNFKFDADGELVNAAGSLVCGANCTPTASGAVTFAPVVSSVSTSLGLLATAPLPVKIDNYSSYTDVKIGSDGIITGTKAGTVYTLGLVAVSNIPNPSGLTQEGGSMYKTSANSGTATYYTAGNGATGQLKTSALETSNVDLANEFANMITTQRGFQANSKIITVSDTMLEELCDMKR